MSMYADPYEKISAQELKSLLLDERERSVTVIDVRDDDWQGGNIRGSINIPLHELTDQRMMELVLDKVKDAKTTAADDDDKRNVNTIASNEVKQGRHIVVFHCFYSQVRGPSAANRFAEHLIYCHDEDVQQQIGVYVLRGGWQMFKSFYGDDNMLVENMKE